MAATIVVLSWLAVAFKARGACRRGAPPARRALWVALLALAAGWSVRVPAGYRGFNELTGVANLAQLVGDIAALSTACAILVMMLHQTNDAEHARAKARTRLVALGAVSAVMAALFVLAPVDSTTDDFVERYAGDPLIRAYMLAYLAFVGYAFMDLTRISRRFAKVSDRRYLTLGMRFIEAAGALGLVYVALRLGYVVAVDAGLAGGLGRYGAVSQALVATVTAFAVIGAVLPALGNRAETYWSYRQLYPLWLALYRSTPEIALSPPSPMRDRFAFLSARDLEFRLHSRTIEIRDGRLALRPYLRHDVADRALQLAHRHQVREQEVAATVEAATLAVALEDKALEREAPDEDSQGSAPGTASLAGEVMWLRQVSAAYTQSPVVREVLGHGRR